MAETNYLEPSPSTPSNARDSQSDGAARPTSPLPAVSLPKGGGAIRGMGEKFAANPVTGTGSMTVPIPTSPGRSGFGPELSLSYDSGAGNGAFGFGWSLSLPSITRKTDKGLPQYADEAESDDFILSGAEDLVPTLVRNAKGEWVRERPTRRTVDGQEYDVRRYRPRIESLFAVIERWTNVGDARDVFWRSISRDNVSTWYGRTAESRVADPDDERRVFSWLICESYDDKGNVVVFGYRAENSDRVLENPTGTETPKAHECNRTARSRSAQRYLKRVRYGNRAPYLPELREDAPWPAPKDAHADDASDAWLFELVVDYGEHDAATPAPADPGIWPVRPDPFSTYRARFEIRTYRICRRFLMFHHFPGEEGVGANCLVRSVDLAFSDALDPADERNPVYTFLRSVTVSGYRRNGADLIARSLPPVEFEYSVPVVADQVEEVDPRYLENLPIGLDGNSYLWTDLYGTGVQGILTEEGVAWHYRENTSAVPKELTDGNQLVRASFAPPSTVALKPNVALADGAEILDLAGDGQPDVVVTSGAMAGLYEHDTAEGWEAFRPFTERLNRDLKDPNLRFVDLDGDGRADVLITEDDALVWHASLSEAGFGPARRVAIAADEERSPRLVFADGTESVHLADLSGDGLADLVRIRNGEVCYWPNLGYGRFGAKVAMDNAPWLDESEQFDQARLRLADIDGSGTTDLIYLHRNGVSLYFNQSGNGWSRQHHMAAFPRVDDLSHILPLDLLGNGTACLVWSSQLASDHQRQMRYVNLMGSQKPHLLVRTSNNLGAETIVDYAPSAKFYLLDKQAEKPWATRLPYAVHVVERVVTYDHVSRNRFTTRYAYHHGYFDGEEREFRGFGMVEQWDTEEFAALAGGALPAENGGTASHVPPVHTKTWFHTGAHVDAEALSRVFAREYFREPGLTDDEAQDLLLPAADPAVDLAPQEAPEASRALKGSMLRQEVYADDAGPEASSAQVAKARIPYSVTEKSFSIRVLQPRGPNHHAVFLTHPAESITYAYERNAADPRISHSMTLEVDDFANVLKHVSIGYGRRAQVRVAVGADGFVLAPNRALAELHPADRERQTTSLLTYTETLVTNSIDAADTHRLPLTCEMTTFELTGYPATGSAGRYVADDFVEADPGLPGRLRHRFVGPEVPFEDMGLGARRRRPIERARTLYRSDDFRGLLPLGVMQSLALNGETYQLAFTPGLLTKVFQRPTAGGLLEPLLPDPAAVLAGVSGDQGGYVQTQVAAADGRFPAEDAPDHWWIPSGRIFHSPNASDDADSERAAARQHFYVPRRFRGPFGHDSFTDFDQYDLLVEETRDALRNRTTVDAQDYRVLKPRLVSDPNGNRSEVAFDALGMVAGTATMGKPLPAEVEGDTLESFVADLDSLQLDEIFEASDPRSLAAPLLAGASTRVIYDLHRFRRTRLSRQDDPASWQPACAAVLARETHASAPLPPHGLRIQLSFSYSDGFGREVQRRSGCEPGALDINDPQSPTVDPRWVGSGWVIYNNKGHPVREFEPFFSRTHHFEFGVMTGVSPIFFYDPTGRVVLTLSANHTYEKVVFDAWQQTTYDFNDNCAPGQGQTGDPRTDPDIAGLVEEYFRTEPVNWQTWHAERIDGALGEDQRSAALLAGAHAGTPKSAYFDPLGRTFVTVERNRTVAPGHELDGTSDFAITRVELDIEGNQRTVRDLVDQVDDGYGRVVVLYAYDLLGNRIFQSSMDAGAYWMLNCVAGRAIRAWDSRGHIVSTKYDELRRPLEQQVRGTTVDSDPRTLGKAVLVERILYGEPSIGATAGEEAKAAHLNLRTRILRQFDSAGVVTMARLDEAGDPINAYDFKGNLIASTRQLTADYEGLADWRGTPVLEAELFTGVTRFDALNRPMQEIPPMSNLARAQRYVIQPRFNEGNLLDRVDVWLNRDQEPEGLLDPGTDAPSAVGVDSITYDAKGQRIRIVYKNGAITEYTYDRRTFLLTQLVTVRDPRVYPNDDPRPSVDGWRGRHLQNLHYTYDPMGNITQVQDAAQQAIFFKNKRVAPTAGFVYDARYRLIQATGREHLGQGGAPVAYSHDDGDRVGVLSAGAVGMFAPNDGNAMAAYTEQYVYDTVGNISRLRHRGSDPAQPGWTRDYEYLEISLLENGVDGTPSKTSNRLSRTTLNARAVERIEHDAHGNVVHLPQLGGAGGEPSLSWDHKNQLRHADLGGGGSASYVYDSAGQRVRKVWKKAPGLIEERIYIGDFEVFRTYNSPDIVSDQIRLERETLHVMDDKQRIAMVETRTADTAGNDRAAVQLTRYQVSDHLRSSRIELGAQAEVISYEEYSPYGSTTYQAVRSTTETSKRYRFTGKERDEETAFNYHGKRYYAPWLARWISPDPAGLRGDVTLYDYCKCNPMILIDPDGLENIVVVGSQHDSSSANKLMFAHQGISQVRDYRKNEASERTAMAVFREGYSKEQLAAMRTEVESAGGRFVILDSADDLISYVNRGVMASEEGDSKRSEDKVSNLDIYSHGVIGAVEFGYRTEKADSYRLDARNVSKLESAAFGKDASPERADNITSFACRTALGTSDYDQSYVTFEQSMGWRPREYRYDFKVNQSLAQKLADATNTDVVGFYVRTEYSDTLGAKADRRANCAWYSIGSSGCSQTPELKTSMGRRRDISGATFDPQGAMRPVRKGDMPTGMESHTGAVLVSPKATGIRAVEFSPRVP